MIPIKVFIDSDVIIASLLSKNGASYFLLNDNRVEGVAFFITDFSLLEIKEVVSRHPIEAEAVDTLAATRLNVQKLDKTSTFIKDYEAYVSDMNDAHIIAGANQVNARFLITFNIRDFKSDKINRDFAIRILKPASLLHYLRSLK